MAGRTRDRRGRLTEPLLSKLVTGMDSRIEFFDSHNWGDSVVGFTPENCPSLAYAVDKTENAPDADREVVTAYRVPGGDVELIDVTDQYRE